MAGKLVLVIGRGRINLLYCHNNVPHTRWFKQERCVFSSSGGWTSEIKVLAGWISSGASFFAL